MVEKRSKLLALGIGVAVGVALARRKLGGGNDEDDGGIDTVNTDGGRASGADAAAATEPLDGFDYLAVAAAAGKAAYEEYRARTGR